jgi:hypothetical protein
MYQFVLSGIQGDCRESGLEQKQIQNGGGMLGFSSAIS